jgi:hypothetical protein
MPKRFLFLAIALSTIACSTVNRFFSEPYQGDRDVDEQAVYSFLLSGTERDRVVISRTTDSGFDFTGKSDMPQEMPGLSRELWEDYLARNDRSYPLPTDMEIGVEYVLLDDDEMSDIFTHYEDGWEEFYSRYPDSPGITTLSRVGFNRDGTEALVYMGTQLHYLAGTGNLLRLEKTDGVWKVMEEIMLWIS